MKRRLHRLHDLLTYLGSVNGQVLRMGLLACAVAITTTAQQPATRRGTPSSGNQARRAATSTREKVKPQKVRPQIRVQALSLKSPDPRGPGVIKPAATRGSGDHTVGDPENRERPFVFAVIAPFDGIEETTGQMPELYWYVSEPPRCRVDFTLIEEGAEQPLAEVELQEPESGGIYGVRLADIGTSLEPNTQYRWYVSLVLDPESRSKDLISGGLIRSAEALPTAGGSRAWYDAVAQAFNEIDTRSADARLPDELLSLLAEAGLEAETARADDP